MAELAPYQVPEMGRIRQIHFIGVGGVGMCGIAEVLLNQGYAVSGSDLQCSENTRRLASRGANILVGHHAKMIKSVDVVVVSSAVAEDNVELVAALEARIPVVERAEMLGELMRYRHGIAIGGTHGKTTTTSLITEIFRQADLSPTFVIGGKLNSAGTNAELGIGRYIVAEADESDRSFLHLQPMTAVVTNIDRDHMSAYGNNFETLKGAFVAFLHRLPFYGSAVVCVDDPVIRELLPRIARPVMTYGFSEDAQFRAVDIRSEGSSWYFSVTRKGRGVPLDICLAAPGEHNVLNALAAIAVASDEGVADKAIVSGLQRFAGVGRRFQIHGDVAVADKQVTLVDDYGHHPTEVEAVVKTARSVWPDKRLVMVYQPHRYTRTQDLFDDFARVLSRVDVLIMLEVYPAGEAPIAGADSAALCQAIRQRGQLVPVLVKDSSEALDLLASVVVNNDMLLVQGAGNVNQVSNTLRGVDA